MPTNNDKRKVELTNQAWEHWNDFQQSGNPDDREKADALLDEVDKLRHPLRKLWRVVTGL